MRWPELATSKGIIVKLKGIESKTNALVGAAFNVPIGC